MTILDGRDILSNKYITAQIIDAAGRVFFVPIKYTIGDYFLAELDHQIYAFKIDGTRTLIYRHRFRRTLPILLYSTDNFFPISTKNNKLEAILRSNSLPKLNSSLLTLFKIFARREDSNPEKFTNHNILKIIEALNKDQNPKNRILFDELIQFLESLPIEEIVTPLKDISEFLDTDLQTADPKFFGSVFQSLQAVDFQHKKVTNTPITAKQPWLKISVLMLMLFGMLFFVGWMYTEGFFDQLLGGSVPGLPFGSSPVNPQDAFLEKYPSPQELKLAVHRGEVNYFDIPKELRDIIDEIEVQSVAIDEPVNDIPLDSTEPEAPIEVSTDSVEEPITFSAEDSAEDSAEELIEEFEKSLIPEFIPVCDPGFTPINGTCEILLP